MKALLATALFMSITSTAFAGKLPSAAKLKSNWPYAEKPADWKNAQELEELRIKKLFTEEKDLVEDVLKPLRLGTPVHARIEQEASKTARKFYTVKDSNGYDRVFMKEAGDDSRWRMFRKIIPDKDKVRPTMQGQDVVEATSSRDKVQIQFDAIRTEFKTNPLEPIPNAPVALPPPTYTKYVAKPGNVMDLKAPGNIIDVDTERIGGKIRVSVIYEQKVTGSSEVALKQQTYEITKADDGSLMRGPKVGETTDVVNAAKSLYKGVSETSTTNSGAAIGKH